MKVWIDGQCFQSPSAYRGIGRYVYELLNALLNHHDDLELHISFNACNLDSALEAREHVLPWIKGDNIHIWHGAAEGGESIYGYTPQRRLSDYTLAHHIRCLSPDIALSVSPFEGLSDQLSPFFPPESFSIPTAAIFYDAIPHRLPDLYLKSAREKEAYRRGLKALGKFDLLFAISEYAKAEANQLVESVPAVNISAGVGSNFKKLMENSGDRSSPLKRLSEGPSMLYVGGLDQRKNLIRTVEAIALLPNPLRKQLQFLLVGHLDPPSLQLIKHTWETAGLPLANLIPFGYASDQGLISLYKQSDLLIQPSLLEGFGLTVLEAIQCGTPVIAAHTGAVPEVLSEKALLFDPTSIENISAKIAWAFQHPREVKKHCETALEKASEFTWQRTAKRTYEAMQRTVAQSVHEQSDPPEDLQHIRNETLKSIDTSALTIHEVAVLMAAAEPYRSTDSKLYIDVTATARIDNRTGIQRVVRNISAELCTGDHVSSRPAAVCIGSDTTEGFFPVDFNNELSPENWDKQREALIRFTPRDTILMLDSSWELYREHYHTLKSARLLGAEVFSVLYDMVPIKVPAFCDPGMPGLFSPWLQSALEYSTGFICISKAVADELMLLLEAIKFPRPMKIGYWHLGANFAPFKVSDLNAEERTSRKKRPTFVTVGTLEPRKGHEVIIDAFEILWKKGVDIDLIIVGRPGWGTAHTMSRILNHKEYGQRLHWNRDASDAELHASYNDCDALIAASYMEGFGLPIVEAGHLGKPAIASDLPVFREVANSDGSVTFFDVGSAKSLAKVIQERLSAAASGHRKAHSSKWLSWSESATTLDNVVRGENWYKIYDPPGETNHINQTPIGQVEMVEVDDGSLPLDYSATLIGSPRYEKKTNSFHITIQLTNESEYTWSSSGRYGVKLGYAITDDESGSYTASDSAVEFPFVIPPNETIILPLIIKAEELFIQQTSLRIGLIQAGYGWWSLPLQVQVKQPKSDKKQAARSGTSNQI